MLNKSIFSSFLNGRFEQMKLTRNIELLIFLIANDESWCITSDDLMYLIVKSLQVSTRAWNSLSSLPGTSSSKSSISPFRYGWVSMMLVRLKRFIPWRMTVVVWSGISNIRTIRPTVPILCKSSSFGSSVCADLWHTTAISLCFLSASRTSFREDLRPTVIGRNTPGNNTILRKGSTGRISPDFTFTSNACSSFPS